MNYDHYNEYQKCDLFDGHILTSYDVLVHVLTTCI